MLYDHRSLGQNPPPFDLASVTHGESVDFCVKAKRSEKFSGSKFLLAFGLFWFLFSGLLFAMFIGPVLVGGESHFELNGRSVVASMNNLEPLYFPAAFLGFFLLIGLGILYAGLRGLLADGPWFIGTPKRLIIVNKDETRSLDWDQFSGNSSHTVKGELGRATFELLTGRYHKPKHGPPRFVPDKLFMEGIPNAAEIERICRQRVSEKTDGTSSIF